MHHVSMGRTTRLGRVAAVSSALTIALAVAGLALSGTAVLARTAGAAASQPAAQSAAEAGSTAPLAAPASVALTTQAALNACAQAAYGRLTTAQRIGQVFMVGLPGNALATALATDISSYHFGSVWFTDQTRIGVAAIRTVTTKVQVRATTQATGGVKFFIAANQEGGRIQALGGTGFSVIPSALSQGTLATSTLTADARTWGTQLRSAGVNLDFAPVADVVPAGTDATNAPIGQLQREFGHDPSTVRSHVLAFIAGMKEAGVATTVKHFPGLGRVRGNTDFVGGVVDKVTTSTDPYLQPFAAAVTAGVPFVMVSLATYTRIDSTHLAAFSSKIIGGILRQQLHFQGVVISDALTAQAVASIPAGTRAIDFLTAGGDMIIVTASTAVVMAKAIAARAASDLTFLARVDSAAVHVLRAKAAYGLISCS